MKIRIKRLVNSAQMPVYAHGYIEDAGADVTSVEDVTIVPGTPTAVRTGLAFEILPGFEIQVRPRSGMALKYNVTVANAPGTIDPGYRGELKVLLVNHGRHPFHVTPGMKIAQLVVARYEGADYEEAEELSASERGAGGFGSSGL